MNTRRGWLRPALTTALASALVLAACSSNPNTSAPAGEDEFISISGSSTVEPISSIVLEDFVAANDGVDGSVDGPGTGDGFALFCEGETDISDASRAISEEEIALCEENGITYIELQIAIDGISVITAPDTPVDCLSFGDLYALLGPESEGFETWNAADALAGEIGSDFGEIHAPYPDADLVVTAPGAALTHRPHARGVKQLRLMIPRRRGHPTPTWRSAHPNPILDMRLAHRPPVRFGLDEVGDEEPAPTAPRGEPWPR